MGGQWHRTCRRIHILYGKGNENHELCAGFLVYEKIISAGKRAEFVSDRLSYIILRDHIILLNVYDPTENKTDDVKDSFHEELERVYDKFITANYRLIREGALHKETSTCQTKGNLKSGPGTPKGTRHQDELTD
jgi:hypothetical protein